MTVVVQAAVVERFREACERESCAREDRSIVPKSERKESAARSFVKVVLECDDAA